MKVTVLIVNYNGAGLLAPCLHALQHQTHPPHQVIVVDNGSQDGSRDILAAFDWPILETVFLDSNTGFSGGNNAGLACATGDIVALLNTDTEVEPAWIAAAIPHFEDDTVGMVACKSLRINQRTVIDKVGHVIYADGLNRGRGTGQPDDGRFDHVEECLWPDGSGAFFRRRLFDDIGLMETRFFLYGEDAELGMRARWAGWRCIFEPRSRYYHHQSAGLGKFSPLKAYYVERNRIWVLAKTFPLSLILFSPFATFWRYALNAWSVFAGRGSAASFSQGQGKGALVGVLFKSLRDGLLGLPSMWRLRQSYPRRISASQMRALLRRHKITASELTLDD